MMLRRLLSLLVLASAITLTACPDLGLFGLGGGDDFTCQVLCRDNATGSQRGRGSLQVDADNESGAEEECELKADDTGDFCLANQETVAGCSCEEEDEDD